MRSTTIDTMKNLRNVLSRHHPNFQIEPYRSGAAVIVVLNTKGQVLLLEEKKGDEEFGRVRGQFNLVTETRREGQTMKGNMQAALLEELGENNLQQLRIIRGTYREADFGPYGKTPSRAQLIVLRYLGNPDTLPFHPLNKNEIGVYRWVNKAQWEELQNDGNLAPSVYQYITQLEQEGIIKPYNEGVEQHDEIHMRSFDGPIGEDILRKS